MKRYPITDCRDACPIFARRYLAGEGPVREPCTMLDNIKEWVHGG